MALRQVFDRTLALAGWFDPLLKVEGWLDDGLSASVGATNHTASFTDERGETDTGQSIGHSGALTDSRGAVDTATDQLTTGTNFTESFTDSTGLTDTGQSIGHSGALTDDGARTDTATTDSALGASPTDSTGLTDAVTLDRGIAATDSRGAVDTTALDRGIAASDTRGAVDTATDQLVAGGTNFTESFTDSRGETDTGQSIGHAGTTVDDRGAVDTAADVLTSGTNFTESFTESRGLTDAGQAIGRDATTTDERGETDTASSLKFLATGTNYTREPSDTVGLTDSITFDYGRGIVDSLGLAEYPTDGSVTYDETLDDSRGETDSSLMFRPASFTDSTGLADLVALATGKALTELRGMTDALVVEVGYVRAITDAATLVDTVSAVDTPGGGTDAESYVDEDNARLDSLVTDRGVDLPDPTGLTDSITPVLTGAAQSYIVTIADDLTLTDERAFSLALELLDVGAVGVDDATGGGLAYVLDIEDTVGLVDIVSAPSPGGRARGGVAVATRTRTAARPRRTSSGTPVRGYTATGSPDRPTTTGGDE